MKSRPAGVACGSSSPRLRLLAAPFSTSGVSLSTALSDRNGSTGNIQLKQGNKKCIGNQKLLGRNIVRKGNNNWLLKYYTIHLTLLGKSICRQLKRKLTQNKLRTDDFVRKVSIYLMTRPFYVQSNFSASFQYTKHRNFFQKPAPKQESPRSSSLTVATIVNPWFVCSMTSMQP